MTEARPGIENATKKGVGEHSIFRPVREFLWGAQRACRGAMVRRSLSGFPVVPRGGAARFPYARYAVGTAVPLVPPHP